MAKVAAITPFLRFYSDDNPGKRDYNSDKQPHWHPITMLTIIAQCIDGMVEADQEQLETLQEAKPKPYVLDEDTVNRVKVKPPHKAITFSEQPAPACSPLIP